MTKSSQDDLQAFVSDELKRLRRARILIPLGIYGGLAAIAAACLTAGGYFMPVGCFLVCVIVLAGVMSLGNATQC